jgi:hypothetical protein
MAGRPRKAAGPSAATPAPESRPELIVVLEPEASVTVEGGRVVPDDGPGSEILAPVADSRRGARGEPRIRPLFGSGPQRLINAPDTGAQHVSALEQYLVVDDVPASPDELLEQLRSVDSVAGAYLKPPAEPPEAPALNDMTPRAEQPPSATPDFSGRQGYLGDPPEGVGVDWSWAQPGGRGEGVAVVDVEGAWRLTHEDLLPRRLGLSAGTASAEAGWRNHGTAVVGVIGSDENQVGTTGIAPRAGLSAVAIFGDGMGSASAIKLAADSLGPGDLLLVELHRPGPRSGVVGQRGFIAVEWWPDDYDAIVYAVSRGVIVVEAAGNGFQDLDDPAYDEPQAGFPQAWRNPFRRVPFDSGAIVVGAGAPPPGAHGDSEWGPDRSRLDFSNFGALVDAQGWGREVTTCGYGDLQGGEGSEDYWYTDQFSGTSSASPIVTGALACAQGILRARNAKELTPLTARRLLRETGSPQQDGPDGDTGQRIGNRPVIRALVERALQTDGESEKEPDGEGGKSFAKLEKNEFKDMLETGGRGDDDDTDGEFPAGLDERLTAVEEAVAALRHFITEDERPDPASLARRTPSAPSGKAGR